MNKELQRKEFFEKQLDMRAEQLSAVLSKTIGWQAFKEVAMVAIMTSPELKKASNPSILQAIYECATLQLLPDGKRAAIVVRGDKNSPTGYSATAQPMVRGIIELFHALTQSRCNAQNCPDYTLFGFLGH